MGIWLTILIYFIGIIGSYVLSSFLDVHLLKAANVVSWVAGLILPGIAMFTVKAIGIPLVLGHIIAMLFVSVMASGAKGPEPDFFEFVAIYCTANAISMLLSVVAGFVVANK